MPRPSLSTHAAVGLIYDGREFFSKKKVIRIGTYLGKLTNTSQILTKINQMFFSNFMQHRISIYCGLYSNFQRVIDIFIFHFKSCICYFSFFHQMIVLKQLWKMLFILSKKDLFVLKMLDFFAFLPSPFFPFRPLL